MADNPLARKLSCFTDLAAGDLAQIDAWCSNPVTIRESKVLIEEGQRPTATCIVLSGYGMRYKYLHNGKRQIVGFLLPGDVCDLHGFLLNAADCTLAMLANSTFAQVPSRAMADGIEHRPLLGRAFWWSTLVDEAIAREWLVNVGQRDAITRLAHFFCELHARAGRVGLIEDSPLPLPLTQQELGDALGLTPVHVNRTLRVLRERGLADHRSKRLFIYDLARLQDLACFNPAYLQLGRRPDKSLGV